MTSREKKFWYTLVLTLCGLIIIMFLHFTERLIYCGEGVRATLQEIAEYKIILKEHHIEDPYDFKNPNQTKNP
jgi:hypothetical protein